MGAGAVRAGRAFVEFFGDDSKLTKALQTNEKRLKAWGANVAKIGAGALAAGSAVLAPLIAASKVFDSMGSQMADVANRTGASVEALSSFGYAAEQTGASLESVESGLRFLAKSGLAAGMNVDAAFRAALKTIAAIDDPMQRAETAMKLFGKSGTALIPMAMELESLEKRAQELGLVMSTEDANAADALGDAWGELTAVAKALVFQVGAALAPAMIAVVTLAAETAAEFIGWVRANRGLIVTVATVAAGVATVGVALVALGGVLTAAGTLLGALAAALVFLVSPIGLVTVGIASLTAWFFTMTETGRQTFTALKDHVGGTLKGIADALGAGNITLAAEVLWASLQVIWAKGKLSLITLWEDVAGKIQDLMQPVWTFLADGLLVVIGEMQKAWANFGDWLKESLQSLGDKLLDTQMSLSAKIATAFLRATGQEDVAKTLQEDAARAQQMRNAARRNRERNPILAEIDAATAAARAELPGIAAGNKTARDSASQARVSAAQQALDEARQRFAEAQQKAADEAVNAAPGGAFKRPGLSIPELTAGMDQAKAAVSGTFSAAAAAGLGGDRQLDTIAGNTGMTNKLLSKIAGKQAGLMVT